MFTIYCSYNGPGLENNAFTEAINQGPKNANYTVMVNFLTNELRALCCIDEQVNAITTPEDHVVFQMELSSFLKELGKKLSPISLYSLLLRSRMIH